ncbi:MAG: MMPL family transporter [Planctomycetes bacterium]|nr:MMPL family transporter [Planctomycetota bacterium]MBI3835161.1 MMPL family transporter [Planctomycetota bacterium]
MNWLVRFSVRRPVLVIIIAVLITLGVSPGVTRIKLRTDGHALVPEGDQQIEEDRRIRREFGLDDPVVIAIHTNDTRGIFNGHTLGLIVDLTHSFTNLQGVRAESVVSLATETNDRVFPGTLNFRKFLEPLPLIPQELDQLRKDVLDLHLYDGTLVSRDEHSTAILVGVPPETTDRPALIRSINDIIATKGRLPETIDVLGAPVAEALLGTHILEDLGVPHRLLGHQTFARDNRALTIPHSFYEVRVWIARHLGLVPLALLVMAAIFFFTFRSIAGVLLPLMEVGACLVFVFAVMGWLNIPIYLTIAVMPVILTAAGVTDEIHLFTHYTHRLREAPDANHVELLVETMQELSSPIIMAAITTAIGFLSFALSPIGPVRAFGWVTAMGVVFCMVWSLTVIPASLALLSPSRLVKRRAIGGIDHSRIARIFGRIASWTLRLRTPILLITVAIIAACPLGISKVQVQDSWIDGFARNSDFYQATMRFDEQFRGGHILLLCVDGGHEVISGKLGVTDMVKNTIRFPRDFVADPKSLVGKRIHVRKLAALDPPVPEPRAAEFVRNWYSWIDAVETSDDAITITFDRKQVLPMHFLRLKPNEVTSFEITGSRMMRPETLREVQSLEEFIRTRTSEAVGGVLGPADYIATVNYMRSGRKEANRAIPADAEHVELYWGDYNRIRGEGRRGQLVDDQYSRSIVTVLMKEANFVGTGRLMNAIRGYEREHLTPKGIHLSFAGDVAVSQTLIDAIVGTQVISVLGSIAGDLIVTTILGRSLIFGILCVIPSALAVLLNFAVMGWIGMPLGVASSMFSAMTLGVGVDYAIHLLERIKLYRGRGMPRREAIHEAIVSTGSALSGNTIAVAVGFGVLILSQVPANARLGGLLSLSLLNCFLATLIVLPAFLSLRNGKQPAPADA